MQFRVCKIFLALGTLAAACLLAGCGNLSEGIARDGSGAQQLQWPQPADTVALHRGGSFPNLDNLHQLQAGLNKQQVMALIGPPHFNEGFVGVREWNYLFNFRRDDGTVRQCEFKVLFDTDRLARSFYWQPKNCAAILQPAVVEQATPPPVTAQTFTLSSDALFAFDSARLQATGRSELDALVAKLLESASAETRVRVIGYSDRLGADAYNMRLSQRRAGAVRDYLIGAGISATQIDAEGRGEADPVKTCGAIPRAQLIACLAPNRRVLIEAEAVR